MAQFIRVADAITQILIVISQEFLLHLAAKRAECRKALPCPPAWPAHLVQQPLMLQ
jgi:hypothetical protein